MDVLHPDHCLLDLHFKTDACLSSQATLIVNSRVRKSQWDALNWRYAHTGGSAAVPAQFVIRSVSYKNNPDFPKFQ